MRGKQSVDQPMNNRRVIEKAMKSLAHEKLYNDSTKLYVHSKTKTKTKKLMCRAVFGTAELIDGCWSISWDWPVGHVHVVESARAVVKAFVVARNKLLLEIPQQQMKDVAADTVQREERRQSHTSHTHTHKSTQPTTQKKTTATRGQNNTDENKVRGRVKHVRSVRKGGDGRGGEDKEKVQTVRVMRGMANRACGQ